MKPWVQVTALGNMGGVTLSCNSRIWELEATRIRAHGQLWLVSELEDGLREILS